LLCFGGIPIKIYYYPDYEETGSENKIRKTIKGWKKEDSELYFKVDHELEKYRRMSKDVFQEEVNRNLKMKSDSRHIKYIKRKDVIFEFRIPPRRKKAVVRIYFCFIEEIIFILEAERKTEKEPKKLEKAFRNYKMLKKEF